MSQDWATAEGGRWCTAAQLVQREGSRCGVEGGVATNCNGPWTPASKSRRFSVGKRLEGGGIPSMALHSYR